MLMNQKPEIIELDAEHFGGHTAHWQIMSSEPAKEVTQWLAQALDQASFPFGLCQNEQQLPSDLWLLESQGKDIQISQIIAVENNKPTSLKVAFPTLTGPYTVKAKITRILHCTAQHEAVLRLELENGSVLYSYDTLYAINQQQYAKDQWYNVHLSAWAYTLEQVPERETMLIDDPAAVRHHRALNDILADNNGETPDNLQELLAAWQPKSTDDELPVTIDISKMVAYLYGENVGQEDEAWFQGDIVGKSETEFMGKKFVLYDVALLREEKSPAVIIRLAYPAQQQQFEIGSYIRGNIWIQTKIYDTTKV